MKNKQLSKEEQETVNWYDKNALSWSEKHGLNDKRYFQPELDRFNILLPKGETLEIGSGYGGDAKYFVSRGYEYIGIDVSQKLIELARLSNPTERFINMSLYELKFKSYQFDGFWTSSTLIHIPKNKIKQVLKNIHTVVKKDGIGFISVMEGNVDMENSRPGRYYTLYSQEEFSRILTEMGYEIIEIVVKDTDISLSRWLCFFVKVI
jgi:2-polyprenyl-3-methyl-5-hydroxy-6-metoxy-1,4-benzoquinol methylase